MSRNRVLCVENLFPEPFVCYRDFERNKNTIFLASFLQYKYQRIVYSPFSDRVGLSLHNILSPFLPLIDIFSVDLKFCHVHFYTL